MASLVADYGESSGDSEENEDSEQENSSKIGSLQETKKEGVSFFGESVDDSSGDSDSEKKDQDIKQNKNSCVQQTQKLPNPFSQDKSKLPSPCLGATTLETSDQLPSSSVSVTSSVFINPFVQAEQAKLGILEKHVRLTEAAPQKPASKQMCFKFKKGRCHLGDKCRFFHDMSNIVLGSAGSGGERADSGCGDDFGGADGQAWTGFGFGRGDATFQYPGFAGSGGERPLYHPAAQYSAGQPADPGLVDDDNYIANAKGKKRFGVTDSLLPPKRAMMALGELRKKERPWTAKNK